jgi:hypothetical protein
VHEVGELDVAGSREQHVRVLQVRLLCALVLEPARLARRFDPEPKVAEV